MRSFLLTGIILFFYCGTGISFPVKEEEGGLIRKSRSKPSLPFQYYYPNPYSFPSPSDLAQSETLKCDNGTPFAVGVNDSIGWMEAIQFTASDSCSLYALLFWPADPDTEYPDLYWRVWTDNALSPGVLLDSGTTSINYGNWFRVTLPDTEKIFFPSGSVFYIGWASVDTPFYWNAFDDTLGTESCNYWFDGTTWEQDFFFGGDFLVRGLCETLSIVGVEEENSAFSIQHSAFRLFQNHPNPFNSTTLIRYQIPLTPPNQVRGGSEGDLQKVELKVYDLTGRLVETLVDKPQMPGIYQLPISNNQFPSGGVYFYRLQVGSWIATRKMTFLR